MPHRFPDGLPAVLPATVARLERRLPAPGEIMVRMDSKVEPDDLIGQCSIPGEPVLIDVAGALGIDPRQMMRRLRRRPGERIGFRDLLARRRSRNLLAPVTGTITAADETTGFVVLTPDPTPASVSAMLRGTIVDVQPQRAVTIATSAAVVQGAAGFGAEQWAMLRLLVDEPGDVITPEMIDARCAFSIIVGGSITVEALHKAQREQVKGIIVGSIDADDLLALWGDRLRFSWSDLLRSGTALPLFDDAPTVVITEGFGSHAMSRPTFDLLTQFNRQEIHLDGTTRLDAPARRPRVIIPLPRQVPATVDTPQRPVEAGGLVRLLDEAHLGVLGRVEAVRERGRLPSGVRMAAYTVVLEDGARVTVPRMAIESAE